MTNPYGRYDPTTNFINGVAELLKGLGVFKDPQKEERARLMALLQANPQLREQYQQQFANNPEGLKALLGRKPMWGGKDYGELERTITGGQVSPEAIRSQQINQLQAKDVINRNLPNIANANVRTPELSNFSRSTIADVVNKGIAMSPEEQTSIGEYNALGRFLTPTQRSAQEIELATAKAQQKVAENEAGMLDVRNRGLIAGTEAAETQAAEAKRKKEQRIIAEQAMASLPKNQTIYTAAKSGFFSGDQVSAIQSAYPERYDSAMSEYFQKLRDTRERELHGANLTSIREARVGTFAQHIMEKAITAGISVSYDQAVAFANDPKGLENFPQIKKINDDILEKQHKEDMRRYRAEFLTGTSSVRANLAKPGAQVDEGQLQQLNNASINATPPGYDPVIYGIREKPIVRNWWFDTKQNVPVIISGDPRLMREIGIPSSDINKSEGKPNYPGLTGDTLIGGRKPTTQAGTTGSGAGGARPTSPSDFLNSIVRIFDSTGKVAEYDVEKIAQQAINNRMSEGELRSELIAQNWPLDAQTKAINSYRTKKQQK